MDKMEQQIKFMHVTIIKISETLERTNNQILIFLFIIVTLGLHSLIIKEGYGLLFWASIKMMIYIFSLIKRFMNSVFFVNSIQELVIKLLFFISIITYFHYLRIVLSEE